MYDISCNCNGILEIKVVAKTHDKVIDSPNKSVTFNKDQKLVISKYKRCLFVIGCRNASPDYKNFTRNNRIEKNRIALLKIEIESNRLSSESLQP